MPTNRQKQIVEHFIKSEARKALKEDKPLNNLNPASAEDDKPIGHGKKFYPMADRRPPTGKELFLIDVSGKKCVGFFLGQSFKLATTTKVYTNIKPEQIKYWAI